MKLSDLKHAVFEDDGPPKPERLTENAAPHATTPVASAPIFQPPSVPVAMDVADHSDDAYQKLAAKSDFKSSPVFQTIKRYLDPIDGLALDEKTKFKIALNQAQAQEGVSAQTVLGVFDQCKANLQQAADSFQNSVKSALADQVDARKQKADVLSAQIQDLQAQVKQLTEEGFSAQQKIQAAQHQFETALQTRISEITQAQSTYATLVA